ncbi:hypothetical protein A2841_03590 [Candidatus Kaiserbacteria bacterium RIFCSPHIGHO2_01_FULL_48_10]|uniref:Uncharacterized protein n=1 Tax=Candidatus Kaiserbacteria bacterium RIFCSPHIGHO2_01_FULL_48_10 TaxID=1798476 RepID=A0A1F6C4K8_9BACT|nr:MAG: hypothetical protein A2841_03590 [Candidatus Kaiserbacteria bacterium RIFCSPHIGHO2_01_FULL_48_10]
MGKPFRAIGNLWSVPKEQTQGSETSQYLEEKKPNHISVSAPDSWAQGPGLGIPLVAASEKGVAQTVRITLHVRPVHRKQFSVYRRKKFKILLSAVYC